MREKKGIGNFFGEAAMSRLFYFVRSERAQGLLEYAIILVLVAVAVVVVLGLFGEDLGQTYQNLIDQLRDVLDPG